MRQPHAAEGDRPRHTVSCRDRMLGARCGRLAVAAAASLLGVGVLAGSAGATPSPPSGSASSYHFRTVNNKKDVTFNQLLGINKSGVIAGYFGSGAQGAPNKGYLLFPHYQPANYRNENFPGSVQTQVTGLNDRGVTVGFWSDQNNANMVNDNFGFYRSGHGGYHTVNFPTKDNATPPVNQLLGVNDRNVAVGFYTDAQGANHGYTYNISRRRFRTVSIPGATSVTAAAINNRNDIAGFDATASGMTDGFLLQRSGRLTELAVPGATMTQAFGVNNRDEVVGSYQVGSGSTAKMHGFTWTPRNGFQTVDDPNGIGTTTINGVNDAGELVGFYVDAAGNTDGMLATPSQSN